MQTKMMQKAGQIWEFR